MNNIPTVAVLLSLFVSITVGYLSLTSKYISNTELTFSLIILILGIIIFSRKNYKMATVVVLSIIFILFVYIWGANVPYVFLIPIISFILLTQISRNKYTNWYILIPILTPLIELHPFIPLDSSAIPSGFINILIITILQILIYTPLAILLRVYRYFSFVVGSSLTRLTGGSKNFLQELIIKGLYVSIVLHFVNNVINSAVWAGRRTQNLFQILKIYADSNRDAENEDIVANVNLGKLLKLLTEYYGDLDYEMELSVAKDGTDAKAAAAPRITNSLAIMIFHDILHNYYKYSENIKISITGNTVEIRGLTKQGKKVNRKRIYSRNLGNIRQLLEVSGFGELKVQSRKKIFITRIQL